MTDPDLTLTVDDIGDLNRDAIARAAAFVNLAGAALVAVGALGCLAWLWSAVRVQQQVSPGLALGFGDGASGRNATWLDRVDLFAPFVGSLVIAALVVGFGLLLRLSADFVVARSGGTITGFQPGDRLDDEESSAAS
jgi:hypothetical protein